MLVGSTIGSGIFRVPASVAARLQEPGPVVIAWVIGGAIALFGALTLAELAAALPRSGGVFAYLLEGFGPLPAFLFGWSELTVIRASALGAIATIFAEYLGYFLAVHAGAGALRGRRGDRRDGLAQLRRGEERRAVHEPGHRAQVRLAGRARRSWASPRAGELAATSRPRCPAALHLSLIATALIAIMWTYDGWADLSFMGGEVKDPGRTLPLALIIGTAAIVVVYLLLNFAYIYLVPLAEMAGSPLIAATAAERITALRHGGSGGGLRRGDGLLPRRADRLDDDRPADLLRHGRPGSLLPRIARVSPKYQSPSTAIWLATALGVIYVLLNDFQQLADKFILGIWPFYALAVAAVFVLRRTRPDLERPYRTWGYPVVPLLFLLASVGMVVNALVTDPVNTGITFGIILAGVPVYYAWRALAAEPSERIPSVASDLSSRTGTHESDRLASLEVTLHPRPRAPTSAARHAVRERADRDEVRSRLGVRPHVRPA